MRICGISAVQSAIWTIGTCVQCTCPATALGRRRFLHALCAAVPVSSRTSSAGTCTCNNFVSPWRLPAEKAEAALAKMATQRDHVTCAVRHTCARECTCSVTLHTLRLCAADTLEVQAVQQALDDVSKSMRQLYVTCLNSEDMTQVTWPMAALICGPSAVFKIGRAHQHVSSDLSKRARSERKMFAGQTHERTDTPKRSAKTHIHAAPDHSSRDVLGRAPPGCSVTHQLGN